MKKTLTMVLALVLVAAISVGATLAYLTSTDEVVNTFTVGNVAITLYEKDVDNDNNKADNITLPDGTVRDKANSYKLMPGHTYDKDPTVTVKAGSEESYVRMFVTINNQATLDEIFAPGVALNTILTGWDSTKWEYIGDKVENDTRTYELRYHTTVEGKENGENADVVLEPLFTNIVIPGTVTGEQLAELNDLTINVVAQAIQANGAEAYNTADAAWAAYEAQVGNN